MSDILGKLFGKDKDKSHKGDKGLHHHHASNEGTSSGSHSTKWNEFCKYFLSFTTYLIWMKLDVGLSGCIVLLVTWRSYFVPQT